MRWTFAINDVDGDGWKDSAFWSECAVATMVAAYEEMCAVFDGPEPVGYDIDKDDALDKQYVPLPDWKKDDEGYFWDVYSDGTFEVRVKPLATWRRPAMTLAQFRKTRQEVPDLGKATGNLTGDLDGLHGFAYAGGVYMLIIDRPSGGPGARYVLLYLSGWDLCREESKLPTLEAHLYEWALEAGALFIGEDKP